MPFIAASYGLVGSSRRIRRNDGPRGSTVEDITSALSASL
jgi:hypothetical protein